MCARAAARAAEDAASAVERDVAVAWAELRAARDPLVALDAPALGDDLVVAWTELVAWARVAAEDRAAQAERATRNRASVAARRSAVVQRVVDDLAAHDIAPAAEVVSGAAATAVATALERA